ncbi:MAG: iron ABC transporter permease [Anaerolineales bacterium]|nr:MAG: iron ABC transporter permease [Anaerolineales bacterium]
MQIPATSSQPFLLKLQASSRRFFHWLTKPHVVLALIMLGLMAIMVVNPLYQLVETTFTWQPVDTSRIPGAVNGEFTLFHWIRMSTGIFGRIYTYTPLMHSMTIAMGTVVLALIIGGSLAWLVVRTDMPGRKLVTSLAVLPYIMPSWTLAQAWLVLFKNRTVGGAPGMIESIFGVSPPDWLSYGPVPIIICCALHYYTFFFLFVSAALMSIDSNLEEAGELMGADRWRILRKITLPLVLPALLSGFIMTFSKVMGTFGGPNILGSPVRYYVVATMIRGSLAAGDKADAFVLAIVLIMFSMVTISLNQRLTGTRRSYETIGGRGFVSNPSKLRNMKKVLFVVVISFQLMVLVVPLGLLIYDTFLLRTGDYSLSNLTLQNWIGQPNPLYNDGEPGVLLNPKIYKTAWNSIRLALYTSFFTALLGVLLGYSIVKGRGTRLAKLIDQLAYIPYVIPGIAFGAVYIAMFAKKIGPLPSLYGTFALLVIVSVAKHIPYSSRSGVSAMMQVGHELEEAAQVSGASVWQRFRRVIFPLTMSGFISGFLLTFITTMRELSLIILLVTRDTQLLASLTMRYIEAGRDQMGNIVVLILIIITIIGNAIISRFSGGSLKKGLGM